MIFFGKLFPNWWQWFNFWKIVTLPQCVNGRVDFLILKNRKLKKFRISRFRGWWCFFSRYFVGSYVFGGKREKLQIKIIQLWLTMFFFFFFFIMMRKNDDLDLMMNLTRNCFRWDLMFRRKILESKKENEGTCNQSESNFVNKDEKEITILRDELLDCVFLLTSEKGCFISRLILY